MKKLTILALFAIIASCNRNDSDAKLLEYQTYVPDSTLENLEQQLIVSDTTVAHIGKAITEKEQLKKENAALKIELKVVKDSLVYTKKLIKKRNLLQKVLGIKPDTITITTKDTTHVE